MRGARFFTTLALVGLVASAPGREPTQRELLNAVEAQLKSVATSAGPGIACVVVSRSEQYPKPPVDTPGKLGGFDLKEFVAANPTRERAIQAQKLDLSDPRSIPDNGYAGGVVIDPAGLVLTTYHVTDRATKIYVFLPGGAGSYADIHAADARSDLAVLKLLNPPPGLKAVPIGDVRISANPARATVFTGKLVVLMANTYSPTFGLDRPSAGFGSIDNIRRYEVPGDPGVPKSKHDSYYKYGTLLEHTAHPNAGLSGAALLNLDGELIGVGTATAGLNGGDISPGHAIPADANFRRILDVLRRGEEVEYGFLGVVADPTDRNGIVLQSLTTFGPAAIAGLQAGDTIAQINGVAVTHYEDLLTHIGGALAGSKVQLTVSRFGRVREVTVTLGKFQPSQPYIASSRPEPVFGLRVEHGSVLLQKLPDSLAGRDTLPPPGVSVREIVAGSPAAERFKALDGEPTRWLLTAVNGTSVSSPAEFYKAARGHESIKLTILDPADPNSRPRTISLP